MRGVRQRRQTATRLKQAGLLSAIPMVLLIGPAVGYWLGAQLDAHWSHAPWGMGLGIALGLASSARVTIQFIRQAQAMHHD